MADIEEGLWREYQDDGVLVYGVNNENPTILRNFIEQTGITFPVITGTPEGYTILGGLSPFPRDYIIDPEGIVRYAATEYRPTEMASIIERYLPTGVGEGDGPQGGLGARLPRGFLLRQNFPNPFNPSTTIRFEIGATAAASRVDLSVYSVRGKRVRTLIRGEVEPGTHDVHWDGTDDRGSALPSGIYIYRLDVDGKRATRKMLLAR